MKPTGQWAIPLSAKWNKLITIFMIQLTRITEISWVLWVQHPKLFSGLIRSRTREWSFGAILSLIPTMILMNGLFCVIDNHWAMTVGPVTRVTIGLQPRSPSHRAMVTTEQPFWLPVDNSTPLLWVELSWPLRSNQEANIGRFHWLVMSFYLPDCLLRAVLPPEKYCASWPQSREPSTRLGYEH